ncbi:hypothetical protein GOV07_00730 [Candidatus Woesearchaeota archaeon]|nr:hypothetical protein [Candidatus Woesearchaeota archaeon]
MQPRTRYAIAIVFIIAITLALRLMVSFQIAEPGYDSYFALLQADSITDTGLPRYDDPYSYQGRTFVFDPAFYYLVAAATILPDTLAVKLLPNLLMVLLIPFLYLITHSLTKNRPTAFIAAIFAGLSPALFATGINQATPITLALPVLALLFLALLDLKQHPKRVLILTAFLTLVSPLIWLVLATELTYLLILSAEKLKISQAYLEISIVTLLMAAWYTLITYKEALYAYGFAILHESLPAAARAATFQEFSFLAMLYAVGVVPIALGSLALYTATFEQRNRKVLFIASLGLVTLLGAVLRLIPLSLALVLLSLTFAILAAPGLNAIIAYAKKTKLDRVAPVITAAFLLLFLLTSLLPALVQGVYPGSSPTPDELSAAKWLSTTPSVIAAAPTSGFLLNHIAQQPYLADEAYLLAPDPDRVLAELDMLYTTHSSVAAVDLAERHGVTHILLGPREYKRYPEIGAILNDERCFPRVYQERLVMILGVECAVTSGPAENLLPEATQ